jgi:hypothetical protein
MILLIHRQSQTISLEKHSVNCQINREIVILGFGETGVCGFIDIRR